MLPLTEAPAIRGKLSVVTFLAFFSAIAISGSFYIYHQFKTFRQTKQFELTAIADLKAAQIGNWYGERMSDASVIFNTPTIQRQAERLLDDEGDPASRRELLAWMETVRRECGYQFMALYSADGAARCMAPAGPAPGMEGDPDFREVVRAGVIKAGDLHRDQGTGAKEIHFDIMIPAGPKGENGTAFKGVWLLRIDPYRFLYPLVQSWPTPSKTAETLLVRRDGNDVLFLNELRHRPGSALMLRRPMDRHPALAATQALRGREGVVERPDYREVPTLAAMRRIDGTPWVMVAKMDTEEIYAPLWQSSGKTVMLLLVLAVAAALGASLKGRRRAERALQEVNELLESRVRERTATLSEVNARLSGEIAQRRLAQEQLQEQHRLLVAAKKMETIGQLAGGVAHEVRNPLNAILSITEALFKEREIAGNPDYEPYIQHIRSQVGRLARLMNDLLDLGKPIPPANLQAVPLYRLCRETADLWRSSATAGSRDVVMEPGESGEGPAVLADGVRLEQVIFNLLENAAQHSPDGSEIAIRLDLQGKGPGAMARILVCDRGRGVPSDKIDRVFEPFFTDRRGGTGLGLTLARHFVESMGGSMELANNDPPPGCSATVSIPRAAREAV